MAITAEHIRATLLTYLDQYPQEKDQLAPVLTLLDQGKDLTSRKEFAGHATAGAILTDPAGKVLFIEHKALSRWLLPGGHLERTDSTLSSAALRELTEETGIQLKDVVPLGDGPLHIDIHSIPANPAKGEGAHQHIDFRFLFSTAADVADLQAEEVTDAARRGIETITDENLRARVAAAIRR
jgi:8-oxo-dGTP pyrophosphatase MutT (NUDIX family)